MSFVFSSYAIKMNEELKSMKKGIILCIMLVIAVVTLSSCSSSSSSSGKSNGYSSTYNNSPSYRNNVNSIADTFGEDSKHVDSVINSLFGK